MTINLAAIEQATRPGMNELFGLANTYGEEYRKIYGAPRKSNMNIEEDVEFRYTGTATEKPEGQPITEDTMGQRVITYYRHKMVASAVSITHEAIADNLYKTQFPQHARSMRDGIVDAENILGCNVLNSAFNPAFPGGDGQPICSVAHPIDGGSYANTFPVGVDFSELGVENALIAIQQFRMMSGMLANTQGEKLIVPSGLQFDASRLLNSQFRTGVDNNDISAIYHGDYLPGGHVVIQHLTNQKSWFIKTNAQAGLKNFVRENYQLGSDLDFYTKSVKWSAMKRISFGISNFRGLFGVRGAA